MRKRWAEYFQLHSFPVGFVKKCGIALLELLLGLLNVNYDMVIVPIYSALFKWKGDEYECSNSTGIHLLNVVDKLYCRMLI